MVRLDGKIYVAGHAGLVGSAIVENLRRKGYSDIIGRSSAELDLKDGVAVRSFFETESPDYVFLAAAKVGGIVANNKYRGEFIYDNLMIQSNVIDAAYRSGVKKLLFLGSTCIYPREAPQPMKEEYLLTSPLEYTNEPYAIAKIAGIKLCESYNIQYGTNFISVMPTNLYGPNDNFNLEKSHVLPALIRKMHLGKALSENNEQALRRDFDLMPVEGVDGSDLEQIVAKLSEYGVKKTGDNTVSVEIWGTGAPMREFLWSEDMADACVYIMENVNWSDLSQGKQELRNCHINIGSGKEVSISDLAGLVAKAVGFGGDIVFDTSKPDGTMRKLTDPTRLHSLGWHHTVELDQGVGMMYEWYKGIHGGLK